MQLRYRIQPLSLVVSGMILLGEELLPHWFLVEVPSLMWSWHKTTLIKSECL